MCLPGLWFNEEKSLFEIRGDKTEATSDGLKAFKELRAMAESGRFPEMTLDEITLTRD